MMRLVNLIVKIMERFLSTPVPKQYEPALAEEPQEPEVPEVPDEGDPYKSVTAWCYVCRQQLGDEHDTSDPGCTYGPE